MTLLLPLYFIYQNLQTAMVVLPLMSTSSVCGTDAEESEQFSQLC